MNWKSTSLFASPPFVGQFSCRNGNAGDFENPGGCQGNL